MLISVISITIIVLVLLFYVDQGVFFSSGTLTKIATSKKVIALTFDDGPHPEWTPKILKILKENEVQASFFVVGECVLKHPEIVQAIAAEGHCIGNHSYGHEPLWTYSKYRLLNNLKATQNIIKNACGKTPEFVRPPKGILRPQQKKLLLKHYLKPVLWTLNTKDWCSKSAMKLKERIKRKIMPGDILLFHDGGGYFFKLKGSRQATIDCLKELIPELKNENWSFVTLDKAAA